MTMYLEQRILLQTMVSGQKMLASIMNFPIVTPQYTDEFVKRSNEITENIVSAVRINYQSTINARTDRKLQNS